MQIRQMFIDATCSRTGSAVGESSLSFLSSLGSFPRKFPNESGMRAEWIVIGTITLPAWMRLKRYTSFMVRVRGFSIGARQGVAGHSFLLYFPGASEPMLHRLQFKG